jgi:23S rRNA G2445 N2-methylase RlmL
MTSPLSQSILAAFTEGSIRYRLEFVSKGHQRGTVRLLANRAYAICPDILNDPQNAPWSMDILPEEDGITVELRPKLTPDPRYIYRQEDIRVASHPPLAACMARLARLDEPTARQARLAGKTSHEIVWDPFCGSGLELIERGLLGGVQTIFGTDLSTDAIVVCRANIAAARLKVVQINLACCDFRNYTRVEGLKPGSVTLVVTNPPMGRRSRVPNLRGLIQDLFSVAAEVLKPGGRLIFANPLRIEPSDLPLKLKYRKVVDLGGFDCRLEMYLKMVEMNQ